ncbi:MAG: integral rane sensor signal transduction histidine kinase [Clostridia bacterium]|nr:integral rane sensor signal transduction histidine kinase [Clostridia bacterium]
MFNLYSIKNKLIVFFLIIIIIPSTLITSVMYYRTKIILMEKKGDSIINNLLRTSRVMDSILSDAEDQLTSLTASPEFYNELKKFCRKDDYSQDRETEYIWNKIFTLQSYRRYIQAIYIYLYDQKIMFTSYNSRKVLEVTKPSYYHWLSIPVNTDTNSSGWVLSHGVTPNVTDVVGSVFILKKKINNIYEGKAIGEACIAINLQSIRYSLLDSSKEGREGAALILDNDQIMLSSGDVKDLGEKAPYFNRILNLNQGYLLDTVHGKKVLIGYTTSKYTGWKYVSLIPYSDMILNVGKVRNLAIGVSFLSAGLAFFLAYIFSQSIYKPIKTIENSMKSVQSGNFKVQITEERKDEFGLLNRGFNQMVNQIQKLIDELYHQKLLYKEAEVKNLQAQINPHFLYNTLDSIHWMARLNKMKMVSELTFSLSHFYRLSLSGGKEVVTVKETIDLIKEYLSIQKVRYGDKFNVHMDLDETLFDYSILHLIIQPLVENSICHGIEKKKGQGNIRVKLYSLGKSMMFTIQDDGVGIPVEKLEKINQGLRGHQLADGENFALVNIHKRIQLYYGEEYGLKIQSRVNQGTTVQVLVPIRKN